MIFFCLRKTLILLLFLSILGCFSKKPLKGKESVEKVLDNITEVPKWLIMNVDETFPSDSLNVWVPTNNFQTSSLIRVPRFPRVFSDEELKENKALNDFVIQPIDPHSILQLTAIRNEQISAQIAIGAKQNIHNLKVKIEEFTDTLGNILDVKNTKVRYVQFVPVQRSRSEYKWSPKLESIVGEGTSGNMSPNVVGDPLIELTSIEVPAYRAQPVWFTIKIPESTTPGLYTGTISVISDNFNKKQYQIQLKVLEKKIPNPNDYKFHLDMWVNPSAIANYYKLKHWSQAHWDLIYLYMKEYASRGGKNIATTITHEPWRKPWIGGQTRSQIAFGYQSMVQWLQDDKGDWEFDFSIFNRYVDTASNAGINKAIHAFSMTPFHTDQSIHFIDKKVNKERVVVLDLKSDAYEKAWGSFLIAFQENLIQKGYFDRTFLAFDEKPEEIMKVIMNIIKKKAPKFLNKIVVAGHPEVGENAKNLSISYMFFPEQPMESQAVVAVLPTIAERKKENRLTTFYLCAEPAHPNTLTYSPAVEGQMIPWLAIKYGTDGYLRWAFNNWTDDPYEKPVFIHTQGDDYQIYPGEDGPISSIRWELLKEGIEDYELFNIMKENGNISEEALKKAIEFATRNQDGRHKTTHDLLQARNYLVGKIN